jgi:hypothetical protein
MVAVNGLLEPEAGHLVQAALEPLARPAEAGDDRKGSQRTADALAELCRRSLEGGQLPKTGGVRPQLLVTVDLDTPVSRHGPRTTPTHRARRVGGVRTTPAPSLASAEGPTA